MSSIIIGVIFLCLFLILMAAGIPIPFAMLFCGAVGIAVIRNVIRCSHSRNPSFRFFSVYTYLRCVFNYYGIDYLSI